MTAAAVLMGLLFHRGVRFPFVTYLLVLFAGYLLALLLCLKQGRNSGEDSRSRWSGKWLQDWSLLILANIPLLLFLGLGCTTDSGKIGMVGGIALVWVVGYFSGVCLSAVRKPLVVGGVSVAGLQFMPCIHLLAAVLANDALTGSTARMAMEDAFWVTLLTAVQLVLVALLGGILLRCFGIEKGLWW
jgi:hypothetical protein